MDEARNRYENAIDRLFAHHGLTARRRFLGASGARPIHLVEHGEGDPLLFIHGGLGFGASYAALLAQLPGRRVFCPDRPGHGLTYPIDYTRVSDYRADAAAFVERVVDELGLERVEIVGNSMGGFFGVAFALAHPQRVRRLHLVGAPAGVDRWIPPMLRVMGTPIVNRVLAAVGGDVTEAKARNIHGKLLVADASSPSDAYYACAAAAMAIPGTDVGRRTMLESALDPGGWRPRYAVREELASLDLPVRFVWGEHDAFAPPSSGEDLARRMPDARLALIEGAGHLPWLDRPVATAEALRAFLEHEVPRAA